MYLHCKDTESLKRHKIQVNVREISFEESIDADKINLIIQTAVAKYGVPADKFKIRAEELEMDLNEYLFQKLE